MDIERWRSSKQVRNFVREQERAGARHLNQGDRGAIAEIGSHTVIYVAIGRDKLVVQVTAPGSVSKALRITDAAVPHIR